MKMIIDIDKIKGCNLSPTMYCILFYVKNHKPVDFEHSSKDIEKLEFNGFIKLVGSEDTIFLRQKALDLFEESKDDFATFWSTYPRKVGDRILRSADSDTREAKLLKIKYENIVNKNPAIKQQILEGLKKEIAFRRKNNTLMYMQLISTYMNQRTWEKYYDLDIEVSDSNINEISNERVEGI